ncbi:hypothetical protein [Haloechinothrix alba]|nr:hypothetical protein [Haloechinothrix alba]
MPIPGRCDPRHVEENPAAANLPLSADEVAELDARFPPATAAGGTFLA